MQKPEGTIKKPVEEKREERIVRILSRDIEGKMKLYVGLTKIKGVSWSMSNAVCKILNLDKNRTIGSLTEEEIKKVSDFLKNPKVPVFLVNRRFDFDTGENRHLIGTDLDLRRDFDIKRLKSIRSYRGLRHQLGQPTRGQRTQSHFRKNKLKSVGLKKKAKTGK
ncbi:30S ribosomal protein S13 [Candidatus Pacearchaeota archaeon]|nr:30S ribosomal protein S13 [Candidatus Pacearchaeota archaeon]